ncbi:MAG: glycosyltransferase family 2 protein [Bacteroidales bacterium]|nr:glycosyltransferase family 2 protein [Bacteroidales bacterium]
MKQSQPMLKAKLSIIVPVKDGKDFVRRCLDSIKMQMTDEIEVIVIDDGSTDGTTEILKEYFNEKNFGLYRQDKSKGVSMARNAGIECATGDFITFIDADDEYCSGAIKLMLNATKMNRNLVQFNHYKELNGKIVMPKHRSNMRGTYSLYNLPNSFCMVWNKVLKKQFLLDNHIWFKDGMNFGEDELFILKCLLKTNIHHEQEPTIIKHFDNKSSICHNITQGMLAYQDAMLLTLYWSLKYHKEDEKKIDAIEGIIREHRKSKLYQNIGLEEEINGRT